MDSEIECRSQYCCRILECCSLGCSIAWLKLKDWVLTEYRYKLYGDFVQLILYCTIWFRLTKESAASDLNQMQLSQLSRSVAFYKYVIVYRLKGNVFKAGAAINYHSFTIIIITIQWGALAKALYIIQLLEWWKVLLLWTSLKSKPIDYARKCFQSAFKQITDGGEGWKLKILRNKKDNNR